LTGGIGQAHLSIMNALFPFHATTRDVTVHVAVSFLPEQSRIEAGKWFWVYHIRIENGSTEPVQLLTRHWRITDGAGWSISSRAKAWSANSRCCSPGEP
jgi:ApaG protein